MASLITAYNYYRARHRIPSHFLQSAGKVQGAQQTTQTPLNFPTNAELIEYPILRQPQAEAFTGQKLKLRNPDRVVFCVEEEVVFCGLLTHAGLVVRRWRTISHAPVHEVSKVEDATPKFEEKLGQDGDSVAEATRKKMVSRAASQ